MKDYYTSKEACDCINVHRIAYELERRAAQYAACVNWIERDPDGFSRHLQDYPDDFADVIEVLISAGVIVERDLFT